MNARRNDPLDVLWQAPSIIWMMAAGEGLSIMLTLALGIDRPFRFFGSVSLVTQWILLLTLAALYVLRGVLGRMRIQTVATIALGLLLANAWAIASVAWMIFQPAFALDAARWNEMLPRLLGIVLVAGTFSLVAFHWHAKARAMAVRAKQAELEALRARIQPHFLFNTLNTALALVREQPSQAEQVLLDLADLFRAALGTPRDVPLADELTMVRRYLQIESMRLGPRLRLDWDVPDPVPDVDVPGLSIQPLVENAVRHGVEPSPDGGCVCVRVRETENEVRIVVENDIPTSASQAGHHVGLESARRRIEAVEGGRAHVEVRRDSGRHIVAVVLPAIR